MTREVERIVDQLDRAYAGEAWHGPDLSALLKGVDSDAANSRPIEGAHTISELVRHIIVWQEEAVRRLEGKGSQDLPPEEDWPEAGNWPALVARLDASHRELRSAIDALDDTRLEEVVPGHPGNVYALLHGVVQHNLYHGGQVALLKKALRLASR